MKRVICSMWVLLLGGVIIAQDKKPELFAANDKEGLSMQAPGPGGKDQMWEAKVNEGRFYKDSAVLVTNRIDKFAVEVNANRLQPNTKWPDKMSEISKQNREGFLKPQAGAEKANFKECKLVTEDEKAKWGIGGRTIMHHIILTNQADQKIPVIQFYTISSDVLYVATVTFEDETYKKYWAKEGQMILGNVKKIPVKKEGK